MEDGQSKREMKKKGRVMVKRLESEIRFIENFIATFKTSQGEDAYWNQRIKYLGSEIERVEARYVL